MGDGVRQFTAKHQGKHWEISAVEVNADGKSYIRTHTFDSVTALANWMLKGLADINRERRA